MINSTVKAVRGDTIIIPIIALLTQGAGYRVQLRQSGDSQNYFVLSIEDGKIIIPSGQSELLTQTTWFAELEETTSTGVVSTIQKTTLFIVNDITKEPTAPDWTEEGSYKAGELIARKILIKKINGSLKSIDETIVEAEQVIKDVVSTDSAIAVAEGQRVTAETSRANAEQSRSTAEGQRVTAETSRANAEQSRSTAEASRVTAENARISAGSVLQTQIKQTLGIGETDLISQKVISSEFAKITIDKYVKQSESATKYFSRSSASTITYPDSQGYAWAMTIVPTSEMTLNGAIMKPTKTMTEVLLCVLQLPDDISVPTGTITALQEVDITKKWNENIGIETEFYFDTATFLVGKNYAIGYRDAFLSTHIGYYSGTFLAEMSQVRPRILTGSTWIFSPNNTFVPFVVPGLFDVVKVKTSFNDDKSIEGKEIANNTITGDKIKDGSITEAKIADNIISTAKIKDNAITPEKTNLFEYSKNLFNPNDSGVVLNHYIYYNSGLILENENYNVTGPMPVTPGVPVTMSYKHQIVWLDFSKSFVSGSSSTNTNKTQNPPTGVAFIQCTVAKSAWSTFQLEVGTEQTSYEPYGFTIKKEYIPSSETFFPSLAVTRKMHVLANNENSVYFKSLIERWDSQQYLLQSFGTNWIYRERYARVNSAAAGNLTISTHNNSTLTVNQSKTITVVVSDIATNNGAKIVQVVGDSFTYNGYFFDKANSLCPDLTFVGMRKSYNTLLKAEGRGGWTLLSYMNTKYLANDSFSPFIHPVDPYRYFGNTAFWIAVKAGSSDYGIAGFTDIANTIGFNATTGLKAAPAANDVMYNNVNARYEVYNGSAWVAIAEATLAFTLNYGKYLTTWGITMPDIVAILLGCNDFRDNTLTDETFLVWKNQMDTLLTSVRSAATALGKTVKIAICLPMTETASVNNSGSLNPAFQRAHMFDARRRIIAAFDNDTYSNIGVDIVDTGTAVDGDFGFAMSEIKPFSDYTGTQREMYSGNVPHPNNEGYAQMGVRLAGYIQAIR